MQLHKQRTLLVLVSVLFIIVLGFKIYFYDCRFVSVYIVRHGETILGNKQILYNDDVFLTKQGKDQAHAMARRLLDHPIKKIYTSPLARAFETASVIAQKNNLALEQDVRLKERDFGSASGMTTINLQALIDERPDLGIEKLDQYMQRVISFLDEKVQKGEREIFIVGHSGTVKAFFDYMDLSPEDRIAVPYCSLFTFNYYPCSKIIKLQEYQVNLDN